MTTETQTEVAGLPAPVALEDKKPEVQNTPEATAASGEVETKEQAPERTFTQAELDAAIQKRLVKEQRRIERNLRTQLEEQRAAVAPKREAFQDDDAYTEAQIEHRAEQLAREKLKQREKAEQSERMAESFQEKAEKVSERYPDFSIVVGNPALSINETMAEFIAESDLGPDVAYHLGKHPLDAARIASMSAVKATRELTRLEAELAGKPKATPSNAPEPIRPVGTRGKPTSSALPSDDDTVDVWMKKEQARLRAR